MDLRPEGDRRMTASKVAVTGIDALLGKKDEWESRGSASTRQVGSIPGVTYVKPRKPVDPMQEAQQDPMQSILAMRMLEMARGGGGGGGVNLNIGGGGGGGNDAMLPFMLSQLMGQKKTAISAFQDEGEQPELPTSTPLPAGLKGSLPSSYSQHITDTNRKRQFRDMGNFEMQLGQEQFERSRRGMSDLNRKQDDGAFQQDIYEGAGPKLTIAAYLKLASEPALAETLKQLTGGGTDQYAKSIMGGLTPEHLSSARAGGGDVSESLLNEIIPQQILFEHATRAGGGNPEMGKAVLDAYLKSNPSASGLGLKALLKQQIGKHLQGVSNATVAEQLGDGGMESLLPQQGNRLGRDDIMAMIQSHIDEAQQGQGQSQGQERQPPVSAMMAGADSPFGPGSGMKVSAWNSKANLTKVADLASTISSLSELVGSPFRKLLGSAGETALKAPGFLKDLFGKITDVTPEDLAKPSGAMTSYPTESINWKHLGIEPPSADAVSIDQHTGNIFGPDNDILGTVGRAGDNSGWAVPSNDPSASLPDPNAPDPAATFMPPEPGAAMPSPDAARFELLKDPSLLRTLHPMVAQRVLGLAGLTAAGAGGAYGLQRRFRSKAPSKEDVRGMRVNKFLDEQGQPFKFDPESFQDVVGKDPSFQRMSRGMGEEGIKALPLAAKPGLWGTARRGLSRFLGGGKGLDAAQAAMGNVAAATGGNATSNKNILNHLRTVSGAEPGQSGNLMARMMTAARAPAAGQGQVSQAMGDTGGFGGLNIQSPQMATPYMMMHALRG